LCYVKHKPEHHSGAGFFFLKPLTEKYGKIFWKIKWKRKRPEPILNR
jgi:hypothetical protein